jgi:hypothetical protein
MVDAADAVEERRLSRSIRADDRMDHPPGDPDIDVLKGLQAIKFHAEVSYIKNHEVVRP